MELSGVRKRIISGILALACLLLVFIHITQRPKIEVKDDIVIGYADIGDNMLVLQLYDGYYENDFSMGPYRGANWVGNYSLVIVTPDGKAISEYKLQEWKEPLRFGQSVTLNLTDYNKDGNYEVLIGQRSGSNFNSYYMYYITSDMEIGFYEEIGELLISSESFSPILDLDGNILRFSYYDNMSGETVVKEMDINTLGINE